jgi:hypothetical protein
MGRDVTKAGLLAPIEVNKAIATERGVGPIRTENAIATERGTAPIKTQQAIATAAGTAPIDVSKAIGIEAGTAPYKMAIAAAGAANAGNKTDGILSQGRVGVSARAASCTDPE